MAKCIECDREIENTSVTGDLCERCYEDYAMAFGGASEPYDND